MSAAPQSPTASATATATTAGASPKRSSTKVSPRLSGRNLISMDNLPVESQFAMKTLNVTVDGEKELPVSLKRSDIGVQVLVSLEQQGKRDEKATKLAAEIQAQAQQLLSQEFTATTTTTTTTDGQYLLKVYVVLAAERSLLHKVTLGLIGDAQKECLEWFLQSQTVGSQEICKAGRVGGGASTAELCDILVDKLGVPK